MAGVARAAAKLSISGPLGDVGLPQLQAAEAVTNWVGPLTVEIATGVSEQSIVVIGTQGLTTITDILITSDQAISVTYGVAGNNVPVPLAANKFHLITGTSLTALSITNASGNTASVTYHVAGS